MQAIEFPYYFTGKGKIEIPVDYIKLITPKKKIRVIILIDEAENADGVDEKNEWYNLSQENFSNAYSNNEPNYTSNLITEPNADYKKR